MSVNPLQALRETLLKFKNDSAASSGRINRLKSQIEELDSSIKTQTAVNTEVSSELEKVKITRKTLLDQIEEKTKKLEEKSSMIADKVVKPADDGILSARRAIDAFEEMKVVGHKLQLLLSQVNPGQDDKEVNTCLSDETTTPFHAEKGHLDVRAELLETQMRLMALMKEYRETNDTQKGTRPKSNPIFENISQREWEGKLDSIAKMQQRQVRLRAELDQIEEEKLRPQVTNLQPVQPEMNGVVVNGNGLVNGNGDMHANANFAMGTEQTQKPAFDEPSSGRVIAQPVEQLPQSEEMGGDFSASFVSAADIDEDDETPYVSVYANTNHDYVNDNH
jgi:chromosome segregation ATPase